MDKKLLEMLQEKKKSAYCNPCSILKEFDDYLECKGIIVHSMKIFSSNKLKTKRNLSTSL